MEKHPHEVPVSDHPKTFFVGALSFPYPAVFLAPLAGVTDIPFRRIAKRYGTPDLMFSEMIASEALVRQSRRTLDMCHNDPELAPFAIQLAGARPEVLAEAARACVGAGALWIDLNMGCPVKKVALRSEAGAALMRDPDLVKRIVEAVVQAVAKEAPGIPVTIKMRKGWNAKEENAETIGRIAYESGARLVTIHGRTRDQFYSGKADWPFIGRIQKALSIPVIGNGDVRSPEDASDLLRCSSAHGVMVGRGALGRPWMLRQIKAFIQNDERLPSPQLSEHYAIVTEHLEEIFSFYGNQKGPIMARKHLAWYSKGLDGATAFRIQMQQHESPSGLRHCVELFYTRLISEPLPLKSAMWTNEMH